MRILVCGGRRYGNHKANPPNPNWEAERNNILRTLYKLAVHRGCYEPEWMLPDGIHIIAGGAAGADSVAIDWAVVNWLPFTEYKADWDTHGKKAGYLRNKQMLDEGKPDLVIAFPGGKGTANMVKLAREANVEVIEIKDEVPAVHRT